MTHHLAGLARLTRRSHDDAFRAQLAADYKRAELTDRERAILDYAAKLTLTPGAMVEDDLAPMRAAGLDDRDILHVNLAVGYFAFANRLADGLGVPLESSHEPLPD